nr:MAG TPA: hypothetical protein [Caudoviricetes sp.]
MIIYLLQLSSVSDDSSYSLPVFAGRMLGLLLL